MTSYLVCNYRRTRNMSTLRARAASFHVFNYRAGSVSHQVRQFQVTGWKGEKHKKSNYVGDVASSISHVLFLPKIFRRSLGALEKVAHRAIGGEEGK